VISTHAGLTTPARDATGDASTVLTGPLIDATVRREEVRVERRRFGDALADGAALTASP